MAAKFRTRSPDGRNPLEMRRKIMSLSLHRLHYLSKTSYLWMRKFASKCLFCLAVQTENEDNSLGDNGTHWFVFLIFICQQTNIKDTRSQGASWALTSSWWPLGLLDIVLCAFVCSGCVTHATMHYKLRNPKQIHLEIKNNHPCPCPWCWWL